jgi:hypothetical protein
LVRIIRGRDRRAAPALRGGVDGGSTYASLTEVREALAQAYDAAGMRDSARVYWTRVAESWARGDQQYRARADTARLKARSRFAQR